MLAEGYMRGMQEEVSQLSLCYGVDRSSYTTNTTTTRHECLNSIEKALDDGNKELAELLARDALIKFPNSIALMVKLSEILFKNGDFDGLARYLKQIKTIDEGLQYLQGTPFFKSNRDMLAGIIER